MRHLGETPTLALTTATACTGGGSGVSIPRHLNVARQGSTSTPLVGPKVTGALSICAGMRGYDWTESWGKFESEREEITDWDRCRRPRTTRICRRQGKAQRPPVLKGVPLAIEGGGR